MNIDTVVKGILRQEGGHAFIERADGRRHLAGETIWRGYLDHFRDCPVLARALPQTDYEHGRAIYIVWPDAPAPPEEFVELYYNERLVKYPASILGHNAINVNGRIFNFSHLLNENEVITPEEYFYRPALGEFAPSPDLGRFEIKADGRVYLDKFGRRFMRSIHVLRIFGVDVRRLGEIFGEIMQRVHAAPLREDHPEKWRDFHPLLQAGFTRVAGRFPRDLFVNAAYHLSRRDDVRTEIVTLGQLKVAEAPYSEQAWMLVPGNYWRQSRLLAER